MELHAQDRIFAGRGAKSLPMLALGKRMGRIFGIKHKRMCEVHVLSRGQGRENGMRAYNAGFVPPHMRHPDVSAPLKRPTYPPKPAKTCG